MTLHASDHFAKISQPFIPLSDTYLLVSVPSAPLSCSTLASKTLSHGSLMASLRRILVTVIRPRSRSPRISASGTMVSTRASPAQRSGKSVKSRVSRGNGIFGEMGVLVESKFCLLLLWFYAYSSCQASKTE